MVLGSLLAAVLAGSWVTARGIEKDIDSRVTTALGQTGVQVVAAGRDIELAGAVADDPELEAAAGAAARVAGVRRVTSKGGVAPNVAEPGLESADGDLPTASATIASPSSTQDASPSLSPSPTPAPRPSSTAAARSEAFPVIRLLYSPGTYSLNRTGMLGLNRIAIYLKAHPDAAVIIRGHSDSQGSANVKKRISLRRAEVVQAYIVSRGVARARTTVEGLSDSRPSASNATAAGRSQNRRVTITLEDAR